MQMDRRFADYAFTGGFFLICQLVLVWVLGYWPQMMKSIEALAPPSKMDPSITGPMITGVTAALALIAVFVIGLLLDLAASAFRPFEIRVFSRHLDRNKEWINNLIEMHRTYAGYDYETIQRSIHAVPLKDQFGLNWRLWKPEHWRHLLAVQKVAYGWGFTRSYERLLSFLQSYVVVQSGSAQLTIMADQYSLWRTARAIAMALTLFIVEGFTLVGMAEDFERYLFLFQVGQLIVTALTYYITLGTYSRLCFTLFSLVYVTYDKQVTSNPASRAVNNQPSP
jgi:hypothetical protein